VSPCIGFKANKEKGRIAAAFVGVTRTVKSTLVLLVLAKVVTQLILDFPQSI